MQESLAVAKKGFVKFLPDEGYVRLKQVLAVYPIGKTSWYEGIKKGLYPPPVKLVGNNNFWHVDDIRSLIKHHKPAQPFQGGQPTIAS